MRLNILYQTDNNYAPYTGVSMTSLFERNKNIAEIFVYILDNKISEDNKRRMKQTAKTFGRTIEFIPANDVVEYIKQCDMPEYRGGYTNYLKLFAGNYFKTKNIDIDRLVFIDSDTLVLGDLSDLITMDLKNNLIAMVEDSLTYKFKNKYIGLEEDSPYYNAGFVLFDMKLWLEEDIITQIKSYVVNVRSSFTNHEQDILNVMFKDRILTISPKYNFQPIHDIYTPSQYYRIFKKKNYYSNEELNNAKKDIRIYHTYRFIGIFPWDDNDVHPANELFDNELYCSEWKNYKKKKKNLPGYIKLERVLYKYLPKMVFLKIFQMVNHVVYTKSNRKNYIMSKKTD